MPGRVRHCRGMAQMTLWQIVLLLGRDQGLGRAAEKIEP